MARAESQQDDLFFSSEMVEVFSLNSGPGTGFDDGFLLLVTEAGFKLFLLCTLFCKYVRLFVAWNSAVGGDPLQCYASASGNKL